MDAALASQIMRQLNGGIEKYADPKKLAKLRANRFSSSAAALFNHDVNVPRFRFLGSGHFSLAFEAAGHPMYAFKVGLKQQDSGAAYAAFCRDKKLPHLPEIIHLEQMNGFYFVCMPQYTESDNIEWDAVDRVNDTQHQMSRCLYQDDPELTAAYRSNTFPELFDTLREIKVFFKGIADFDLHQQNYMCGSNGEVVITDPVSFKRVNGQNMREGTSWNASIDLGLRKPKPKPKYISAPKEINRLKNPLIWGFTMPRMSRIMRWIGKPNAQQIPKCGDTVNMRAIACHPKPVVNGGKTHLQLLGHRHVGKPSKLLKRLVGNVAQKDLTGLERRVIAQRFGCTALLKPMHHFNDSFPIIRKHND